MTRVEYQWRDEGSGTGHMQRVRVYEQNPLAAAYRRFIVHSAACGDCREDRCPAAEVLWRKYWEIRHAAAARSSAVRATADHREAPG